MKKILLPLAAATIVFFTLVILACENRLPGYRWLISGSAVIVLTLAFLAYVKLMSRLGKLGARLTNLFVETRTEENQIDDLLNREATRVNVEELIAQLRAKSEAFESVKKVPPPPEDPPSDPESRLARVLRDNYPL